MRVLALLAAFILILQPANFHVLAGPPKGVYIPTEILEVPSELGFKRYDGPSLPRFDEDGPKADPLAPKSKTVPLFTHPTYPGLIFEDIGDLGKRLALLGQLVRGPPVVVNLLGPNAAGTQILDGLANPKAKVVRYNIKKIDDLNNLQGSSGNSRFPIVFAHLKGIKDGKPLLGAPDGTPMFSWDELNSQFAHQGLQPIVFACNSYWLEGVSCGVPGTFDVNEAALALQGIGSSKTLGELLVHLSKASSSGLMVKASKQADGWRVISLKSSDVSDIGIEGVLIFSIFVFSHEDEEDKHEN